MMFVRVPSSLMPSTESTYVPKAVLCASTKKCRESSSTKNMWCLPVLPFQYLPPLVNHGSSLTSLELLLTTVTTASGCGGRVASGGSSGE